jgi:hypothetical protein
MATIKIDKFNGITPLDWGVPEEPDMDHDPLMICPNSIDGSAMCMGCSCYEVHCESECGRSMAEQEAGCPECQLIDQEEYDRLDHDRDPLTAMEFWAKKMFAETDESLLFKKFSQNTPMVFPKGGTYKFRRYDNSHLTDAMTYGIGVMKNGTTITKDYLQKEATGRKDSDSPSD